MELYASLRPRMLREFPYTRPEELLAYGKSERALIVAEATKMAMLAAHHKTRHSLDSWQLHG